jgi:hypothetical protein
LEPLTQFKVERLDDADNGSRRARMQRFLHGPEGFSPVRCLDEDEVVRIEAKRMEARAMRTAAMTPSPDWQDKDKRLYSRCTRFFYLR